MASLKRVKTIDSRYRVALPREWANCGDLVEFEVTKAGNLLIKKVAVRKEPNDE